MRRAELSKRLLRWNWRMVLALMLVLLWSVPWVVAAQSALGSVGFYRSPEFGYFFWWDADEWTIQQQITEPGRDWVVLAEGNHRVSVLAYEEVRRSAESCLRKRLQEIEKLPYLVRFESLGDPDVPPEIAPLVLTEESVYTEMVLGFDAPDDRVTITARETCTEIVPGEVVLLTSEWMSAEAYNARLAQYGGTGFGAPPLGTITLPWSTRDPGDGLSSLFGAVTPLVSRGGEELLVFAVRTNECSYVLPGSGNPNVVIAIEGTARSNAEVSPRAFVMVGRDDGLPHSPTFARWLWPPLANAEAAKVRGGDVAVLELEFPDIGFLYYLDASGVRLHFLGERGGCGAGGASPIVIDLE